MVSFSPCSSSDSMCMNEKTMKKKRKRKNIGRKSE